MNNTLCRKVNWSDILHDPIEGKIKKVKGTGRTKQLLDYFGNRRRFWKIKEETEVREIWKGQSITRR